MPRSKVKLEYIANDNARRTSYRKRMPSLMKKMSEICTLCGIQACVIMRSPYEPDQLELWPNHNGVQTTVDRFMSMPNIEQNRKMMNQDSYTRKRISKAEEQLEKHQRENRLKHIAKVRSECLGDRALLAKLSFKDLNDLVSFSKDNLLEIETMLELRKSGVPPAPLPPPHSPAVGDDMVAEVDEDEDVPVQDNLRALDGVTVDGHVPVVENIHGALDGEVTVEDYAPEVVENPRAFDGGSSVEDYVPVLDENPGAFDGVAGDGFVPGLDIPGALDGIRSTTQWFTDWIDNMEEHVRMAFSDDPNRFGAGPSSPKN